MKWLCPLGEHVPRIQWHAFINEQGDWRVYLRVGPDVDRIMLGWVCSISGFGVLDRGQPRVGSGKGMDRTQLHPRAPGRR